MSIQNLFSENQFDLKCNEFECDGDLTCNQKVIAVQGVECLNVQTQLYNKTQANYICEPSGTNGPVCEFSYARCGRIVTFTTEFSGLVVPNVNDTFVELDFDLGIANPEYQPNGELFWIISGEVSAHAEDLLLLFYDAVDGKFKIRRLNAGTFGGSIVIDAFSVSWVAQNPDL